MGADLNLSPIDKLIYLGRMAWSQARLPIALRRLSIAADNMRERAFPHGAVLARDQFLRRQQQSLMLSRRHKDAAVEIPRQEADVSESHPLAKREVRSLASILRLRPVER